MPNSVRHVFPVLCLLLLCLTASAATQPAVPTSLIWRGDIATGRSLMAGLDKAWEKAGHPAITLQPFSTISGIDAALTGSADLAGSARPAFARRKQEAGLDFVPVAWDALVMIVHPKNPLHKVTLAQLRDIYYGRITNWQALGGANHPINLYSVASPLDGIEYSLRRVLFRHGNQPVASPRLYINTAQLEAAVVIDPWGLGVSTLSGVMDNKHLAMLKVENVAPALGTVADGSYPLYTLLYLATPAEAPQHEQVSRFLQFLGTDSAHKIMLDQHLLPYDPDSALAQSHDAHLLAMQELSHPRMNGPVAAPGATYVSRAALAPASKLTEIARQRLAAKRARDIALKGPSD